MKRQGKNNFAVTKAFTDALAKLYTTGSGDEFPGRVHSAFGSLFPNVCVSYDEVSNEGGVLCNVLDKPLPISRKDLGERWGKWAAEHPGVVYLKSGGRKTVFQISDFLTERQFFETGFYNEFWKDTGIRHQLSAVVPMADRIISVSINRDTAFSFEEVQLMKLMQPHFAQAHQIMRAIEPAYRTLKATLLNDLQKRLSTQGEIEIIGGAWKGNVITGEIWRASD